MSKREVKNKHKLCVLSKIKENKEILFGAFSNKLHKEDKVKKWKDINNYAQSIGLIPVNKDWNYARDVWWPNVRKSTTEKRDNAKKTGTEGGPDRKQTEVDMEVLDIIGKDSPVIEGLGVPESLSIEPELDIIEMDVNLQEPEIPFTSIAETTPSSSTSKLLTDKRVNARTKKVEPNTMDSDDEKKKLQIELLKLTIYKTKLEARQLEISLGIPESSFTMDISDNILNQQNIIILENENLLDH